MSLYAFNPKINFYQLGNNLAILSELSIDICIKSDSYKYL